MKLFQKKRNEGKHDAVAMAYADGYKAGRESNASLVVSVISEKQSYKCKYEQLKADYERLEEKYKNYLRWEKEDGRD